MTTNVTATLADFAAGLKLEDIPEHVRENCRVLLLDTLACALAGHQGEETAQIAAMRLAASVHRIARARKSRRRSICVRSARAAIGRVSIQSSPCFLSSITGAPLGSITIRSTEDFVSVLMTKGLMSSVGFGR